MEKVTYRCKGCGWEKSITILWADISPTRCPNHKCVYSGKNKKNRTSFIKEPNMLEIILPKKEEKVVEKQQNVEEKVENTTTKTESRKSKRKKARGV